MSNPIKENQKLSKGLKIKVSDYDNHFEHIKIHAELCKVLKIDNNYTKISMLCLNHISEHVALLTTQKEKNTKTIKKWLGLK